MGLNGLSNNQYDTNCLLQSKPAVLIFEKSGVYNAQQLPTLSIQL